MARNHHPGRQPISASPHIPPSMRLVTQKTLRADYGVDYSNEHLLRLEARDKFPRRLKLGGRRTAWFAHEIEAWLQSLREARDIANSNGDDHVQQRV